MSSADPVALGVFLRARGPALPPGDVGMRRLGGLRRVDVAELCGLSADYVARLERGDGPSPSVGTASALARGLRLTLAERDRLLGLCGLSAPASEHVGPGLMRVLDGLRDVPAQVMGRLGETLVQTPAAVALLGEQTTFTGPARSAVYRWFTDPAARERYLPEDHDLHGRTYVAHLQASGEAGTDLAEALKWQSSEFRRFWDRPEPGLRWSGEKRFRHPHVGRVDLRCQSLEDSDQGQTLLILTAEPGTEHHEKLQLLTVLGAQEFTG